MRYGCHIEGTLLREVGRQPIVNQGGQGAALTAGRVGPTLSTVSVSRDRREHLTASGTPGAVFRWVGADAKSPSLEVREGLGLFLEDQSRAGMKPLDPRTHRTAKQHSRRAR